MVQSSVETVPKLYSFCDITGTYIKIVIMNNLFETVHSKYIKDEIPINIYLIKYLVEFYVNATNSKYNLEYIYNKVLILSEIEIMCLGDQMCL